MRWLSLLALPCLLGCHSALDDALGSYTEARYPSAAAQFRALEPAARALEPRAFANYALYRGLTHLALGDARAAARWPRLCQAGPPTRDPALFESTARRADRGLAQHGSYARRAGLHSRTR